MTCLGVGKGAKRRAFITRTPPLPPFQRTSSCTASKGISRRERERDPPARDLRGQWTHLEKCEVVGGRTDTVEVAEASERRRQEEGRDSLSLCRRCLVLLTLHKKTSTASGSDGTGPTRFLLEEPSHDFGGKNCGFRATLNDTGAGN